jgi:hypothetical protein
MTQRNLLPPLNITDILVQAVELTSFSNPGTELSLVHTVVAKKKSQPLWSRSRSVHTRSTFVLVQTS